MRPEIYLAAVRADLAEFAEQFLAVRHVGVVRFVRAEETPDGLQRPSGRLASTMMVTGNELVSAATSLPASKHNAHSTGVIFFIL